MNTLSQFEDEILDLIDNRDEFTRSDLQGMVSVIVRKIANHSTKFEETNFEKNRRETQLHAIRKRQEETR